jgi:hypothetical protein
MEKLIRIKLLQSKFMMIINFYCSIIWKIVTHAHMPGRWWWWWMLSVNGVKIVFFCF